MVAPAMIKEHMESSFGRVHVALWTVWKVGSGQADKDDPDAGGEHHFHPACVGHHVTRASISNSRRRGEGTLEEPINVIRIAVARGHLRRAGDFCPSKGPVAARSPCTAVVYRARHSWV